MKSQSIGNTYCTYNIYNATTNIRLCIEFNAGGPSSPFIQCYVLGIYLKSFVR